MTAHISLLLPSLPTCTFIVAQAFVGFRGAHRAESRRQVLKNYSITQAAGHGEDRFLPAQSLQVI